MAYIGTTPADKYTSFAVQHFTTSATTSYTLDNSVANENEIALFINNVRQQPGSSYAYTASGTTLTLSAATTSSDTMYCVFIGKAVQTVTPTLPIANFSSTGIDDNATSTSITIDASQNVGINTSSPNAVLDIRDETNGANFIVGGSGATNITKIGGGGGDSLAIYSGTSTKVATFSTSGNTFLEGSLYLGGETSSANALDDYEEGTWTGTLTGASTSPATKITSTGVYKKVGSLVHIQIGFENYNGSGYSGQGSVEGLPFTNTSNSRVMLNVGAFNSLTWTDTLAGVVSQSGTSVEFFDIRSANSWSSANLSSGAGNFIWITGTYSQA